MLLGLGLGGPARRLRAAVRVQLQDGVARRLRAPGGALQQLGDVLALPAVRVAVVVVVLAPLLGLLLGPFLGLRVCARIVLGRF